MVDEELLVGLNKVKHLIRHTHDARMPPSPTGALLNFVVDVYK